MPFCRGGGAGMAAALRPGAGIAADLHARWPQYRADWRDGFAAGPRILAPSTFMFLASALPALAFGQQLSDDTASTLGIVHVLIATAVSGIVQVLVCAEGVRALALTARANRAARGWGCARATPWQRPPAHHSTRAPIPVQAVLGGQPLLIIGVAEPIVLIYGFL